MLVLGGGGISNMTRGTSFPASVITLIGAIPQELAVDSETFISDLDLL